MPATGTTNEVLEEYDFIAEILRRERKQGCQVKPGAKFRIATALIDAINAEVTCNTGEPHDV